MNIEDRDLESELYFKAVRSGGKGGQNVNKVSTKVLLSFDIKSSKILSAEEKEMLIDRLKNRTDKFGYLRVYADEERSQLLNKKIAIRKFYDIVDEALKKRRYRHKTYPTLASVSKRLRNKNVKSQKKSLRKKEIISEDL